MSAAQLSGAAARTIHVPAGTFTVPAETFPIDLRGGISLVGAGRATIVEGAGSTTFAAPQNVLGPLSVAAQVQATLLVGDATKSSRLAALSIQPPAGQAIDGLEAIVCDRGNAGPSAPAPNTLVSGVAIAGFEVGVRVTTSGSGAQSGCNLDLGSSEVKNGSYGVVADGLADGTGAAVQPVTVRLENNTFLDIDITGGGYPHVLNGAGLATCDAVTGVVVTGNRFAQDTMLGDWGIWAVRDGAYDTPGFDIENNEFGPLTNGGIWLWGNVTVDRLVNNRFHDISMAPAAENGWLASGLLVYADVGFQPGPFPLVRYARGNSFFANDVGVDFRSAYTALPGNAAGLDFGTAQDPGNNTFRCNSAPAVLAPAAGSDVRMEFRTAVPVVAVPFEGNLWDHAPPSVSTASWTAAPPGTDVWLAATDAGAPMGGSFDFANGTTVATPPCPPGRVAGP